MKNKKLILELILTLVNAFVLLFPIKKNKVTFVSLEGTRLKGDLLIIREQLPEEYEVTEVLYHFNKNDIVHSIGYMFNTFRQIWHINRSVVVLINDNNFVISRFKRPGVKVIQVWHANGAIKKFGNYLERKYEIANYDYVLANSEYWKGPYSKAFGVKEEQVVVTGLPQLDRLLDESLLMNCSEQFYKEFPQCRDKKIVLYAPTFRGNIYEGVRPVEINIDKIMDELGEEYILVCKLHPLLAGIELSRHKNVITVPNRELYELFAVSDIMITDYSSIIFDYTLLNKPTILYAPDLDEYRKTIGCMMEYSSLPGIMCQSEPDLVADIKEQIQSFKVKEERDERYIYYDDGNNTNRVIELIISILNN